MNKMLSLKFVSFNHGQRERERNGRCTASVNIIVVTDARYFAKEFVFFSFSLQFIFSYPKFKYIFDST